jgi:hypothetical protein
MYVLRLDNFHLIWLSAGYIFFDENIIGFSKKDVHKFHSKEITCNEG